MNTFYQVLDATIQTHLTANAINSTLVVSIAQGVVDDIANHFGGTTVYLKNNTRIKLTDKHRQILADFNGTNHFEIYKKYSIGAAWLRKLVKRAATNEPAS